MKRLTEAMALTLLQRSKAAYQSEIKINFEHQAQDCRTCPTAGVCCTDAHFVNVHITRLEAVAIGETLARTPRLTDEMRRRVYDRAHERVARYGLTTSDNTFRQTFSCPLFEPGVGCLVHARAKPAPCIQHACYNNWEDVPPAKLQWQTEARIERLNTQVYDAAWAWLPIPVWLTLIDPASNGKELDNLIHIWSARKKAQSVASGKSFDRSQPVRGRRSLPVLR